MRSRDMRPLVRLLPIAALILSLALALFLRDPVHDLIVVPLSYVLWQLGLFYWAVPELVKWLLLLVFVGLALAWQLIPDLKPGASRAAGPARREGPVESLAIWISRARTSNYFRWQLAHRLGALARQLEELAGRRAESPAPSRQVAAYFAAGLEYSFVDFPGPRHRFKRSPSTPVDADPSEVVDYLEPQAKTSHGN